MAEYYDRQGNPLPDMLDWAKRVEDKKNKVVKQESVGDYWVSTVWLGLNHQFGNGPPLIFETMVFRGNWSDLYCERYSTEEQAMKGHIEIVRKLREGTLELYE